MRHEDLPADEVDIVWGDLGEWFGWYVGFEPQAVDHLKYLPGLFARVLGRTSLRLGKFGWCVGGRGRGWRVSIARSISSWVIAGGELVRTISAARVRVGGIRGSRLALSAR